MKINTNHIPGMPSCVAIAGNDPADESTQQPPAGSAKTDGGRDGEPTRRAGKA